MQFNHHKHCTAEKVVNIGGHMPGRRQEKPGRRFNSRSKGLQNLPSGAVIFSNPTLSSSTPVGVPWNFGHGNNKTRFVFCKLFWSFSMDYLSGRIAAGGFLFW
jgi:hypothetical protein